MKKLFTNPIRIAFILLIVGFIVISAFGMGNLSAPSSYYQTGELENTAYLDAVCYELNTEDFKKMKALYVNFGSFDSSKEDGETIGLKVRCATSETSSMTNVSVKSDDLKNGFDALNVSGWNLVAEIDEKPTNYKYFLITCPDALKINEVVFVGEKTDGTLAVIPVTSVGAGARAKDDTSSLDKTSEFARTDEAKLKADRLIDEQSKFHLSSIGENGIYTSGRDERLTETEYYTVESIRNILSGRSYFIDKTTNPLGQYVMALGTSIFGYNTFGVRVMPFVFSVATLILLYYLGKLLFGSDISGLLFAFLFAIGGYALSMATLGVADAIFAFFIILSFTTLVKFYKKGISNVSPSKSYLNLLLGGAAFSIAFAIKSQALYYAIGLIAVFVIGVVRQYKAYRKRIFKAESDDEKIFEIKSAYKQKLTNTLAIGGVTLLLLPLVLVILTYLFGTSAYGGLYGNKNVFVYAFNNIGASFTAANIQASTHTPVSYLINYDWLKITEIKYVFGNIVTVFLNLFALVFGIATLINTLIESRKTGLDKDVRATFIMPMIMLLSTLVSWIVLNSVVCGAETAQCFLVANVITCGITVAVHNYCTQKDVKPVLKFKKFSMTVTDIVTCVILLAATAVFALSIPAIIGYPVSENLYAWNVLNRTAAVVGE